MVDGDEWKRRVAVGGSMGVVTGTFREQQRLIEALNTRSALQNAAVSRGGLTVKDQGNVTVQDGGNLIINDAGDVVVNDGGELVVHGPNGELIRLNAGRIGIAYNDDDVAGYVTAGLATDGLSPAMWLIPPATNPRVNELESAVIVAGRGRAGYLGGVWINSLAQIQLDAEQAVFIDAGTTMQITAAAGLVIDGGTGGSTVIRAGAGRQLQLGAGAELFLKANGTTTSAANTYISGSGANVVLYQVSSSIRYKVDVEDHHVDQDALLSIVPKSWRDKAEAEAHPDTTSRYVGFIAEELDALGLSEFVVYNPDGTPESVAYDRLTVGLLDVVKTQQQQIAWLTEKVAQLAGEPMPPFRPDPTPGVRATRPVPPSPIVEEEVP